MAFQFGNAFSCGCTENSCCSFSKEWKYINSSEIQTVWAMCPELRNIHPSDVQVLCCLSSCLQWQPPPKTANVSWCQGRRRMGTGCPSSPKLIRRNDGFQGRKGGGKESTKKKILMGKGELKWVLRGWWWNKPPDQHHTPNRSLRWQKVQEVFLKWSNSHYLLDKEEASGKPGKSW